MSDSSLSEQSQFRSGLIYGLIAYTCWGIVPLYFRQLAGVDTLEILAHRITWSLPLMLVVMEPFEDEATAMRRCAELRAMPQGWQRRVIDAQTVSMDHRVYRDYISNSRGEFTVSRDQYARPRTGWQSDRSAEAAAASATGRATRSRGATARRPPWSSTIRCTRAEVRVWCSCAYPARR